MGSRIAFSDALFNAFFNAFFGAFSDVFPRAAPRPARNAFSYSFSSAFQQAVVGYHNFPPYATPDAFSEVPQASDVSLPLQPTHPDTPKIQSLVYQLSIARVSDKTWTVQSQ